VSRSTGLVAPLPEHLAYAAVIAVAAFTHRVWLSLLLGLALYLLLHG